MKYYSQLSQGERYTIAFLLRRLLTHSQIAQELGRHRSTSCREISRKNVLMMVVIGQSKQKAIIKAAEDDLDAGFRTRKPKCSQFSAL
jgi:IS30 family transposase